MPILQRVSFLCLHKHFYSVLGREEGEKWLTMACGLALKRPYECDDYLNESAVDVKRARTTVSHCSPFRPQFGTVAASLSSAIGSSALLQLRDSKDREENDTSPFSSIAGRTQLSPAQLESYLRAEIRYLKRRNLLPRYKQSSGVLEDKNVSTGSALDPMYPVVSKQTYRAPPTSPNANDRFCSVSGSESEGENSSSTAAKAQKGAAFVSLYEKPQFSLRQVQMICERLLKQQEVRLRYEYETVLNQRLDEQHEQYVQFAREQLERQHDDNAELSYLS
ncbi:unnamed protein product [Enterobius vermicularis]|uniref:Akirin n=1 Tax=Enterobius vermicularis TaxID=51028 RepID=A0A0N4V3E7_ENTVE|nr:unnamed protein product [Enterobius vermicularis]